MNNDEPASMNFAPRHPPELESFKRQKRLDALQADILAAQADCDLAMRVWYAAVNHAQALSQDYLATFDRLRELRQMVDENALDQNTDRV